MIPLPAIVPAGITHQNECLAPEDETPNIAQEFWTGHYAKRAIEQAARILEKIDERWPTEIETPERTRPI